MDIFSIFSLLNKRWFKYAYLLIIVSFIFYGLFVSSHYLTFKAFFIYETAGMIFSVIAFLFLLPMLVNITIEIINNRPIKLLLSIIKLTFASILWQTIIYYYLLFLLMFGLIKILGIVALPISIVLYVLSYFKVASYVRKKTIRKEILSLFGDEK